MRHACVVQNFIKLPLELLVGFFLAGYPHRPIAPKKPTLVEVGGVDFVIQAKGEGKLKLGPALVSTLAAQELVPSHIVVFSCWRFSIEMNCQSYEADTEPRVGHKNVPLVKIVHDLCCCSYIEE